MAIINCPSCGMRLKAPPEFAGKNVRCPGCKNAVLVPTSDSAADSPAAPQKKLDPLPPPLPLDSIQVGARNDRLSQPISNPAERDDAERDDRSYGDPDDDLVPCPYCDELIPEYASTCRYCGESVGRPRRRSRRRLARARTNDSTGMVCSILSIVFGGVAFLLCPPIFGVAGIVLGIIGMQNSESKTLGMIGIIVSVIGAVVGMILGVIIFSMMDG